MLGMAFRKALRPTAIETTAPLVAYGARCLSSLAGTATAAASPPVPRVTDLFTSVVKIFCDQTDPNWSLPWQMRRQGHFTGSGFAVAGKRLLTNAHCVANQDRVLVRRPGEAKRYPATVTAVAHECDLAILDVSDAQFWENLPLLSFGELPELRDSVVVVGYPTGGDNLSITAGVVSRMDVTPYAHSNHRLLCTQIDAAINSGNSGGPAFALDTGKVVGVAFQGYAGPDVQNIGYIIPTPVILHLLNDVKKHGKYTGFVSLNVMYQTLENPAIRAFLGLDNNHELGKIEAHNKQSGGVLVVDVDKVQNEQSRRAFQEANPGLSLDEVKEKCGLEPLDVLLELNGTPIASDGTIQFRGSERVMLTHITSDFFTGDTMDAVVLRNKKICNIQVRVYPPSDLVPEYLWDQNPKYFIYGGIVFCPLTMNYLRDEFGKKYYERAPTALLSPLCRSFRDFPSEEIVIVSQILASELTVGYETRNSRLHKVDGIKVQNMKHLVEILGSGTNSFVEFELDYNVRIVMEREKALAETGTILKRHAIPSLCSEDLLPLAKQKLFQGKSLPVPGNDAVTFNNEEIAECAKNFCEETVAVQSATL